MMVAYNFKARFADQVSEGRKTQTIRTHRKRHARPGEPVQLYEGMRTRNCRKLVDPDPICQSVTDIRIWVPPRIVEPASVYCRPLGVWGYTTPAFAQADGFDSVEDFTRFWFDAHGPGEFEGVLVAWKMTAQNME